MSLPKPNEAGIDSDAGSSLGRWDLEELDAHVQVCTFSIEQGPAGLRLLTLCAVTTSCMNSLLVCAGVPGSSAGALRSATSGFMRIVPYMVALCQIVLALSAAVFEVDLPYVQQIEILDKFQDFLLDRLPCLTEVLGRGIFYFLQGIIWLLFTALEEPQHMVIVVWLSVVAMFHVCVHWQWLPRRILAKTRRSLVDCQRDLVGNDNEEEAFLRPASNKPADISAEPDKAPRQKPKPQCLIAPAPQATTAATARMLVQGTAPAPKKSTPREADAPAQTRQAEVKVAKNVDARDFKVQVHEEEEAEEKQPREAQEPQDPPRSPKPVLPSNDTPVLVKKKQQPCCTTM